MLKDSGALDEALNLLQEQARLCKELNEIDHLQVSLFNQSAIHHQKGRWGQAMACLEEQEEICRGLHDEKGLANCLTGQAFLSDSNTDQTPRTRRLAEEAYSLASRHGLNNLTSQLEYLLNKLPTVIDAEPELSRPNIVVSINGREVSLVESENKTTESLLVKAQSFKARGEYDKALALLKEQERISIELDDKDKLRESLVEQGVTLQAQGKLNEAMRLYQEHAGMCRDQNDNDGLSRSLFNQALLLAMYFNKPYEALPLAEDAYKIASTHGPTTVSEHIRPFLEDLRRGLPAQEDKHSEDSSGNFQRPIDTESYQENFKPDFIESIQNTKSKINTRTINTKRNIRIFISSTFQDMQEERDILIKKVFPELRKMCMERGVGFTQVDLRWGVTKEQVKRGEVLPICLAEIEKCRPYFIGLLGERYGWVPDPIPDELIADRPWLAEHRQRSVTELEIVHGVFNNPEMAGNAFFYFRDPPAPVRSDNQAEQKQQTALKNRILESGLPVSENYRDADAVGQLILKDLKEVIDNKYPEQHLTLFEREYIDHEVFAESRAKVYIGRQEYFDRLDSHASGTSDPLVVLGESGSGKSALLANWNLRFREQHPDTFLITHFIGSSTDSTDHVAMLRRIMMEIKVKYDLSNEIPDTADELRALFPDWLSMAASQGRLILVIDALNQLEDKDNALNLAWLPESIPPEVRLIVTTLPGRTLDELQKKEWPTMEVQLLEPLERQQLIQKYLLKLYSKQLPQEIVEHIASQPQCANPLFLHALLEELRIFGKHEELQSRINHYLKANDPEKLYELVLTRLEEDYEQDRPGLVGEALTLLWAARRGLSEPELLEIMDLPPLIWSPLFLALGDSLVTRSGLLTFFHNFLRQSVYAKYIQTPEAEKVAHLHLADFFGRRDIDQRKVDELPWQLVEAHAWHSLQDCLIDLPFFSKAFSHARFDVLAYWQKIENNSDIICPTSYEKVLAAPDEFIDVLFPLSDLFYARGNTSEAQHLRKAQVMYYRTTEDFGNLAVSLGNLAAIHIDFGELDEAWELYKEMEIICRERGHWSGLQVSLGSQAVILQERGEFDEALKLHQKNEQFCREVGNKDGLCGSLNNQALILKDRGELEEAMKLYEKQEKICRQFSKKDGLSVSLNNKALIFRDRGELDRALGILKEVEQICKDIGDKKGLSASFGNQANILQSRRELDEALKLYQKQESICESIGYKLGLSRCLGNQALLYKAKGNIELAMMFHKKEESICREMDNKAGLAISLYNQATIHIDAGRSEETAMKLLKEQEVICKSIGNKEGLMRSFYRQANILEDRGEFEQAIEHYKKYENVCRELDNKEGQAISLNTQATLLGHTHQQREALPLAEEAYKIASTHGLNELAGRIKPLLDHLRAMLH